MQWASSLTTKGTIEACIDEAARSIKEQLGGNAPHLTLIFVSPHFRDSYARISALIRERMNPGVLLGCSGGGIIGGGKEAENRPAFSMTAAHLPGVNIQPIRVHTDSLPDQDTGPEAWRKWLQGAESRLAAAPASAVRPSDSGGAPHFIFLADPFSFDGEEFLAGIDFAYPASCKIGGLASGASLAGGNALYLGDEVFDDGVVGVSLSGNIRMDAIVAQGCRPIGRALTITKCQGNLLVEADGKSPIAVLEKLIPTLSDYDRELLQTSLFLGIEMNPLRDDDLKQGDFLIRNLIGVDRASGALAVGAYLREGMMVQFHLRDKIMSAEDLDHMLSRYRAAAGPEAVRGALLFSCLGRGEYLYGAPNHDSDMFRARLGDIPLGGFFCNGEIGPVGNTTFLHGYTSSFGLFKSLR